ncbi:MAG TPA: hypothetical protein VHV76_14550 [Mycobacteriales bacterium]|nr:hypothetical protein [Mycobacteriales bacterium]
MLGLITENHTYDEAATRLGIRPGLAYLVATGVPTDSSDGLSPEDLQRPGLLSGAAHLSDPRTEQPDRSSHVRAFLSARAKRDPQMQAAAKP